MSCGAKHSLFLQLQPVYATENSPKTLAETVRGAGRLHHVDSSGETLITANIYHILLPNVELRRTSDNHHLKTPNMLLHWASSLILIPAETLPPQIHHFLEQTAKLTSCVLEYVSSGCLQPFMNLWPCLSFPDLMIVEPTCHMPLNTSHKSIKQGYH